MEPVRTIAPEEYPVLQEAAKEHLRFLEADDDAEISLLIRASYEAICNGTGRRLAPETWTWSFNPRANTEAIDLPIAPVSEITAISFWDAAGVETVGVPGDFLLIADADRPCVRPVAGKTWPVTDRREAAVTLTLTVGETSCPDELKLAMLMMLDHLYHHRSAVSVGESVAVMPMGVEYLVNQHRRTWIY